MRKIIHVDMDAFFASVEQRDDPALRGKPVAVGGSARRGVVAAASYVARRFGVRSAMPSVTAARRCPDLIFVRPRFEVYKAVSQQIRTIFLDYTPLVEPLSLDEAYLDVSDNLRGLPSATETAAAIRARIRAETGLTASAGISYNKFLAKLASGRNKPDGQCVITPAAGPAFVAALEVGRFHGVGPRTAEKMNRLGYVTGADLAAASPAILEAQFGKAGLWYHAIAQGIDDRPVEPDRARKSAGAETTFNEDRHAPEDIEAGLCAMADRVAAWCARGGAGGRTVTVKLKFADFRQITRSRTLERPIGSAAAIRATALEIMRAAYPLGGGVRLVGVTLSNLASTERDPSQEPLQMPLNL